MSEESLERSLSDAETDPASSPAGKGSRTVPETLLKTVLSNLETAKKDLDKHWRYLLFGTAISLAIITWGLGAQISEKVGVPGQEKLLFLLVPLVNLYLFMRFGFLLAYFSGVRFAAEDLAERYFVEEEITSKSLSPHLLFGTNSYFEYIHERQWNWGILLYSLAIPFVSALNHAASLLLLWRYFDGNYFKYVGILLYGFAVAALCATYYKVNKERRFNVMGERTIAIYMFLNFALTLLFALLIGKAMGNA